MFHPQVNEKNHTREEKDGETDSTFAPAASRGAGLERRLLAYRLEELNADQMDVARLLLSSHFGLDRGHSTGDER